MSLSFLPLGFFIKIFTGLDDLAITIPMVSGLGFDKTRGGKIAFAAGIFLAAMVAITITFFFSRILSGFAYSREITAFLLFALATAIYFELFDKKTEKSVKKHVKKVKEVNVKSKMLKIFGISFTAFLISSSDDMIAYLPLFLNGVRQTWYAVAGITLAVIFEIFMVIYFSAKIEKLDNKKEITSVILVVLGLLVMGGVL